MQRWREGSASKGEITVTKKLRFFCVHRAEEKRRTSNLKNSFDENQSLNLVHDVKTSLELNKQSVL